MWYLFTEIANKTFATSYRMSKQDSFIGKSQPDFLHKAQETARGILILFNLTFPEPLR